MVIWFALINAGMLLSLQTCLHWNE